MVKMQMDKYFDEKEVAKFKKEIACLTKAYKATIDEIE
jgi:hypothetical protein